MTSPVYLRIRRKGAGVEVNGPPAGFLGHTVQNSTQGVYVEWAWDGGELVVRNDRYGFYPFFYFASAEEVCLSPSIPRLIEGGVPTKLDDAAMAVFLRLGFFIGEDTPFRHIRALPPAARLVWKPGVAPELSSTRSTPKPIQTSRDEALHHYLDLFRGAVTVRDPLGTEFSIPLSGGRDSRHIALELHHLGRRPASYITVKNQHTTDGAVGLQLAGALGGRHVLLQPSAPSVANERRKNHATSYCADEHAWALSLADYLNENCRCVYDGIGGDVLSAGLFLTQKSHDFFETSDFNGFANHLLGVSDNWISGVLRPEFARRWSIELARNHLRAELEQHSQAANPTGSFYFWNRTRREIALYSYSLLAGIPTVFAPFLDDAVYDFLASLPASMFVDRQFHTEAIQAGYPDFASIPFANKIQSSEWEGALRRFGYESLKAIALRPTSRFIRPGFVFSRLAAATLHSAKLSQLSWMPTVPLYLLQLEECAG